MPKITYNPQSGDPVETEWMGHSFAAGKAKDFDGRKNDHKAIIEAARTNPWFDVDGESAPQKPSPSEPTSPEEYRAYALEWIKKAKSLSQLEGRWNAEAGLREKLGWGSDDQGLIDPILQPKIEEMKRAEEQ